MTTEWFVNSVFSNVGSASSAACWAGRPAVKQSLERLQKSMKRMPESTLDLMWASLGAGKTHALLYFQRYCDAADFAVASAFVEMPEQISSFLDLYRRLISSIPVEPLAAAAYKFGPGLSDNLYRASNVILNG